MCKNGYFWNPINCTFEKTEYLTSIIDGLVIIRDEIIEATKNSSTKTVSTETILTKNTSTKTFPKKSPSTNTYILLPVLLINITL